MTLIAKMCDKNKFSITPTSGARSGEYQTDNNADLINVSQAWSQIRKDFQDFVMENTPVLKDEINFVLCCSHLLTETSIVSK